MKRTLVAAAGFALFAASGLANAASWSVFVEPGIYGRVAIGGYAEPPMVYTPQPVMAVDNGYGQVVEEVVDPAYATDQPPVYLWVPEYQRLHWAQYCREYGAVGVPVYFVDDGWYHANVMRRNWTPEQRSWSQRQWLEQDRLARDRYERQRFEQQRYEQQQRWNAQREWDGQQQGRWGHERDRRGPPEGQNQIRWGSAQGDGRYEILSTTGGFASGGTTGGGRRDATVYAHENVLLRMSGTLGKEKPLDTGLWPGNTFFGTKKELYLNGEAVEIIHQPAAHTDGDVIVFFRRSDVVATGDIFVMDTFPMIDRARGGTINGLITAVNNILDIVIPAPTQERGTMLVPGHGRLADEHDLLEYRDMLTIIRNRVQKMIGQGMSLDQVRAARPTFEYEPRWGATTGFWTTAMFVDAVYNSLKDDKDQLSRGEGR